MLSEKDISGFFICEFYSVRGLRAEAPPDRDITVSHIVLLLCQAMSREMDLWLSSSTLVSY